MSVLTFGVGPSGFLSETCVHKHADDFGAVRKLLVTNTSIPGSEVKLNELIKKSMYMDDCITGRFSTGETISLYRNLKTLFLKASLNLRKFLSNSSEVMEKYQSRTEQSAIV